MTKPRHTVIATTVDAPADRYTPGQVPLFPPREGQIPIEAHAVWLTVDEAAVLLGLLELLPDAGEAREVAALRDRWQSRLSTRMSEAMTGLRPDGWGDDD
jgi:hypothetical protein